MKHPESETRNRTVSAMSSGVPRRFSRTFMPRNFFSSKATGGGVMGVAVGILLIPLAAMFNQGNALLAPGSVPLAFGVALLTGLLFGLYPAVRASRLHPIEALRYE